MRRLKVVIAHASDHGARRLARALIEREPGGRVMLLQPETLAMAQWRQSIDATGRCRTQLGLPNGLQLDSSVIGIVLNRIRWLTAPRFRGASAKDRDYADMELQALVTSWLAELSDRVIPSVQRHPWLVPTIAPLTWATAAAAAGLPIADPRRGMPAIGAHQDWQHRVAPRPPTAWGEVLVAGQDQAGTLAHSYGRQCLAMAAELDYPILQLRFEEQDHGPVLRDVSPIPTLLEAWQVRLVSRMLSRVATERDP